MKGKNLLIAASAITAGWAAMTVAFRKRRSIPPGVRAVKPFDAKKYLGQWYEIARFDFRFEKGLSQVTANYSLNADGSIKVINRGYDGKAGKWKESTGRAVFAGDHDEGKLLVTFFGPFYSGYNIVEIDSKYENALVFGRNLDYVWLLSREKEMPGRVQKEFLEKARDTGYDLSRLVWTRHE